MRCVYIKILALYMKNIISIAKSLGISQKHLELYGDYKAKVSLEALGRSAGRHKADYIVVTGITPTPLGEGKTVTTIGLSMAFNRLGRKSAACIRQPSLGPFFGVKGGGLGGGRSEVLPDAEITLHFTGDIHAVSIAHNLCAAFLDNHLYRGNRLGINTEKIFWKRVVDTNDRALRSVRVGLGGKNGTERMTGFQITAASELMAILALAESVPDLRRRIGRIVVAFTSSGKPVTCEDLKVAGSMTALLEDAVKPNLVQTTEGTACFVHTGPFANITHGNSSILADRIAMGLCEFVVTEAGFGADCGLEKFVDIKCAQSGLKPSAAVLVCSVRALKAHSGMFEITPGKPVSADLMKEHMNALEAGAANLEKQIENVRAFGLPCVVAINRFRTDTDRELERVRKIALERGAFECVTSDVYRTGSAGGTNLAKAVISACRGKHNFRFLYEAGMTTKEKIEKIAVTMYGAKGVRYDAKAEENLAIYKKMGYGKLPVCMAKTALSLSHDPKLKGAPSDFIVPVRDVKPSIGAGFLYALCGDIQTMPALPSHPAGERIDIDSKGRMRIVNS
jgi:formate--tetrahydrofolate ligase